MIGYGELEALKSKKIDEVGAQIISGRISDIECKALMKIINAAKTPAALEALQIPMSPNIGRVVEEVRRVAEEVTPPCRPEISAKQTLEKAGKIMFSSDREPFLIEAVNSYLRDNFPEEGLEILKNMPHFHEKDNYQAKVVEGFIDSSRLDEALQALEGMPLSFEKDKFRKKIMDAYIASNRLKDGLKALEMLPLWSETSDYKIKLNDLLRT